jgi:hypothetical protein
VESAVFALAGVLLGGLLTWGTQLWLERRKERRAASRAKRLVGGELLNAILILRALVASPSKTWATFDDVDGVLPTSAWREHRADLAGALDESIWERLVMRTRSWRSTELGCVR